MYIRMAVMLIITLYTARIVFNALGINDYGIYNVVGSIIVMFSFINSGLSNATKRYITAEIATGTDESRRKVFNSAIIAHILIAFIILIIAETVGLWLVNYLLNIPPERLTAANWVYQFSIATALLGIMQSPFTSAILAYERMSIYAYLTIVDAVCKLMIAYLIQVVNSDKLVLYASLIFLIGIINLIVYRFYCNRKFVMCKWMLVHDKALLKKMFTYTTWSLFGQGAVVLSNQGVTFIVNFFWGVAVNAAMGISNQITKVVNDFVLNFQYAFNPQITKFYVNGNNEELKKLVWRSSRYSSYLVLLFLLPVCFEASDLLRLWLGDYPEYSVEFCVLTMICVYLEAITAPLWMVLCSDAEIKTYQLTVSAIFLLNVLFSFVFLLIGLPPYTVIAVRIVVDAILIMARLLFVRQKVSGFSIAGWVRDVFLVALLIVIPPFVGAWMSSRIIYTSTLVRLIAVSAIALSLTVISIYVIGMTRQEKQLLKSFVKDKVKL